MQACIEAFTHSIPHATVEHVPHMHTCGRGPGAAFDWGVWGGGCRGVCRYLAGPAQRIIWLCPEAVVRFGERLRPLCTLMIGGFGVPAHVHACRVALHKAGSTARAVL